MENSRYEAFASWSVPRSLFKFIAPAVISNLATMIFNLTDAFFVGRTGDTFQISAMTITLPLVLTMSAVSMIFGAGGNANVAACLGAGQEKRARHFSAFALYTALAAILVISCGVWLFERPLLPLLGANEDSYIYCKGYLFWVYHAACIPMVFSQVVSQLFSAQGDTRIASIGITGAGLLNVVLDPVMIFGMRMGIIGAGLATCISNYCAMIFFLIVYLKKKRGCAISLDIRDYRASDGIAGRTLAIGVAGALSMLFMNCVDFLRNYLFGVHGTQESLAAWGVVQRIGNSLLQICMGVAFGARPLYAFNYSAGNLRRTRRLILGDVIVMLAYNLIILSLVQIFPAAFVRVFLPIEEIVPTAVRFIRIYVFFILGVGMQEIFNSVFQGVGAWKQSMASIIFGKLIVTVPLLLLLTRAIGVTGIIATQPIADMVTFLTMLILYLIFVRKQLLGGDRPAPAQTEG